jgi:hypothetical protein
MDFIKKHYEKILLGLVLLGLVVAVAMLPLWIQSEKARLEDAKNRIINRPIKPLDPVALSKETSVLDTIKSDSQLALSRPHNLFNPVQWQKRPDGSVIKIRTGTEVGPEAVVVNQITNLYTIITLDSVAETGYLIGIEREAELRSQDRRKKQTYARSGEKGDYFAVTNIEGPEDNPTLTLELADSGRTVKISKENPFMRVDGYMADLEYPPEKRTYLNKRVGDVISIGNERYNIVAIDSRNVVLSAPNEKKTTRPLAPASTQP